ncbi:hypothetical protein PACTADRAFT_47592 [Pachysolen tannophilus NRRL Y-2460]|uniref:Ribosomal protein bL31m N-terminal domain-containing protein n=1 Tax=Pachysolen tannophilus NRRL Y-2460 TaxID=669874 RepID=A0A1E4U169_PACTA|nr:hypothetical protein PACTADRAFT_47592 [Pachysolen tannophilus NRRL Y-2460]
MFSTRPIKDVSVRSQVVNFIRNYAGKPSLAQGAVIPRRPLKKIQIGKARPAIYHKFNCMVELSDGSVFIRRSQFPKVEMRMITDQRNNVIWNESRSDLVVADAGARGRLNRFKEKYADFADESKEEKSEKKASADVKPKEDEEKVDDYLDLLGAGHVESKLGGNIAGKNKSRKK